MTILFKFLRFIVVGGLATCIDYSIYTLLVYSHAFPVFACKAFSLIVASCFSFFMNRYFTFKFKEKTTCFVAGMYLLVQIINLAVNVGVNSLMLMISNMYFLSFVVATGISTIVNFTLQKKLVFRTL